MSEVFVLNVLGEMNKVLVWKVVIDFKFVWDNVELV